MVHLWGVIPRVSSEAHSSKRELICLQVVPTLDDSGVQTVLGPGAATHLNRGAWNSMRSPSSERHSTRAAAYQLCVASSMPARVAGMRVEVEVGRGSGPAGSTAGTTYGLTSCLTKCLRASPRSNSRDGQCGESPASSIRCTPTTA